MPGWLNYPVLFYYHFYCIFYFISFTNRNSGWLLLCACGSWTGCLFHQEIYTYSIYTYKCHKQAKLYPRGHQDPLKALWKSVLFLCDVASLCSPWNHRGGRDSSGLCRVSRPQAQPASRARLVFHPQPRIFSKGKQALIHSHCRGGPETEESPPPQCSA